MSITKSSKDIKFSNNYNEIIKYLSLILDGTEADDTKKKSKKLETLLTETTKLTKDKEEKAKEIRKLETKKKSLKHVFAYHREAENQRTRLHDSIGQGDNLDTNQDFYTDTNPIDNLYKINLGTEIETTEDQMIKTIARIVKALQKVDVADFTAKYNAKESDTTKQGQ
ncbi:30541_t:CDS:2, partial [Racocetra persica]